MTANKELQDAALRHAVQVQRYGKGLAERVVKLLDAADEGLTKELAGRLANISAKGFDTGPATTARLAEMLAALKLINDEVYKKVGAELQSDLAKFAAYEADFQAKGLKAAVAVKVVPNIPPAGVLKQLVDHTPVDGFLLASWTDSMSAKRLGRLEQAVRVGIVQGKTIDQMVGSIRGTKAAGFRDGVLEISRRSAQTLAVTATSTVANAARLEVFKANDDLVKEVQWLSTLDERTSEDCQALDGQVFPLDEPHPVPPVHPGCRSVLVPITKSWQEMGLDKDDLSPETRASQDGQVEGDTKFGGWIKKQPEDVQNEVMGKERAQLFRDGKVPFGKLFDENRKYLSLDELKRREGLG